MADGGVENRPAKSHSEGSEALHDSENELKDVRLKIMMEDNPERKAWFIAAHCNDITNIFCKICKLFKTFNNFFDT